MATTITQVLMIAPELSSETNERIQYFIDEAAPYINQTTWGSKANHAHALLVAHFLTKSPASGGGGGGAGTVTRKKVGDIEVSYAAPASSTSSSGSGFATTSYGEQFESLKRTLVTSPFLVVV